MRKITYTNKYITQAKPKLFKANANTRTKDTRKRLTGIIAEDVVCDYLGGTPAPKNKKDWDFTLQLKNRIYRIDNKNSNQKSTKDPPPYYTGTVDDKPELHSQEVDYFLFTRTLVEPVTYKPLNILWIMGFISKKDFIQPRNFVKEGTEDPTNGYKASCDCYKIQYSELKHTKKTISSPSPISLYPS
jgi:hypothetical protein